MGRGIQSGAGENVSRVEFVKNRILDWIHRQGLRPGDRLVSESRIAAQLGVGPVTAHKAFRALADAGVVVRYPNRKGTFIKGASVRAVGILGFREERKFFGDPYYGNVMAGIDAVLHERGVPFLFKAVDVNTNFGRLFADMPVDGILAVGAAFWIRCGHELEKLARRFPLIMVGAAPVKASISHVSSDFFNDSRAGIERLIRDGHRRIAVFAPSTIPDRLAGFKAALKAAGLKPDRRLIFMDTPSDILAPTLATLTRLRPTAIFDARGFIAPLIAPGLLAAGLTPELLVYDDFRGKLPYLNVKSTVIHQPMEQLGRVAAEQLFGLIDGKVKPPVRIALRADIIPVSVRGARFDKP